MDYVRWELEVLRYAWKSLRSGWREYVMIELAAGIAGAIVGFLQEGGNVFSAIQSAVLVAFVFGVGVGLKDLGAAPYRLYRAKVPPDPTELRERLTRAAVVGRIAMGFHVKSERDFEKWKELKVSFEVAFGHCNPLMDTYSWQRIGTSSYDPNVAYPGQYNDEHRVQWLQVQAVVNAIDRYIDHMDAARSGPGNDN